MSGSEARLAGMVGSLPWRLLFKFQLYLRLVPSVHLVAHSLAARSWYALSPLLSPAFFRSLLHLPSFSSPLKSPFLHCRIQLLAEADAIQLPCEDLLRLLHVLCLLFLSLFASRHALLFLFSFFSLMFAGVDAVGAGGNAFQSRPVCGRWELSWKQHVLFFARSALLSHGHRHRQAPCAFPPLLSSAGVCGGRLTAEQLAEQFGQFEDLDLFLLLPRLLRHLPPPLALSPAAADGDGRGEQQPSPSSWDVLNVSDATIASSLLKVQCTSCFAVLFCAAMSVTYLA